MQIETGKKWEMLLCSQWPEQPTPQEGLKLIFYLQCQSLKSGDYTEISPFICFKQKVSSPHGCKEELEARSCTLPNPWVYNKNPTSLFSTSAILGSLGHLGMEILSNWHILRLGTELDQMTPESLPTLGCYSSSRTSSAFLTV